MKLFTTQQINDIARYTIEHENLSVLDLVERVAEGVTFEIEAHWRPGKPIMIFAGCEDNGAQALAVARMLAEHGYRPEVYLINVGGNALNATCKVSRDSLLDLDPDTYCFHEIDKVFLMPTITPSHLVIDGLFGAGICEGLKGGYRLLVQKINESGATIVSIDVPSGMFGDSNPFAVNRDIIHANLTLAIQFPRIAFFNPDNTELVGEWKIIDIGLSETAIRNTPARYHLIENDEIRSLLKPRRRNCSKADFGSALLVAGSYGMMGAAVLAACGALRSGVGKLTVESPKCGYQIIQSSVPDALFRYNSGEYYITQLAIEDAYNAVAIGPGLGFKDATLQALEDFLLSRTSPVLLDADALNCISHKPTLLNSVPVLSVITPHAAEFDRMFGQHTSAELRLQKAVEMARFYNIIIVLKGNYTATVRPDGIVCFNSSGTPAMATAGSGDVLTGIILSLIAQGYKPEQASIMGVYIHGTAGELAAREHGEYGVTATDIANATGRAIMTIMNYKGKP